MALPGTIGLPPAEQISQPSAPIPPLQAGDRLTRDEFERRYEAMPWLKKAELIEGEVYMPSPVRLEQHAGPDADLLAWLGYYRAFTPGTRAAGNCTIRLDLENEPQPDGALITLPTHGGRAKISTDDYVEGSPELLGEIAASTVSIDLHKKFIVYRRNHVLEYIVWRVQNKEIDWFILRGEDYARLEPDAAGVYRSEVFPGLWLDAAAMIRGDLATVLQKLQEGINSQEHARFVAKLQENAAAARGS
jgi:Uma2 family endonuclease